MKIRNPLSKKEYYNQITNYILKILNPKSDIQPKNYSANKSQNQTTKYNWH